MRFNAEFNATEDLRSGMGWETRENAPKNGGMAASKATLRCCDEESTSCGEVSGEKGKRNSELDERSGNWLPGGRAEEAENAEDQSVPPTAPQFAQAPCPTGGRIPLCISRWCARCPSLSCHTCFSLQHASPQFPFEQIRDRGHIRSEEHTSE